jgi:hypothetical protein
MEQIEQITGRSCISIINDFLKIGIRIAGAAAEREAAEKIAASFREANLTRVRLQEFPCLTFGHSKCVVSVLQNGRWKTIKSEPAAHSPSTSGQSIEGRLIIIVKLGSLSGALFGSKPAPRLLDGDVGAILSIGAREAPTGFCLD